MNEIDEMNEMNEMNQTNEMNEIDEINPFPLDLKKKGLRSYWGSANACDRSILDSGTLVPRDLAIFAHYKLFPFFMCSLRESKNSPKVLQVCLRGTTNLSSVNC